MKQRVGRKAIACIGLSVAAASLVSPLFGWIDLIMAIQEASSAMRSGPAHKVRQAFVLLAINFAALWYPVVGVVLFAYAWCEFILVVPDDSPPDH